METNTNTELRTNNLYRNGRIYRFTNNEEVLIRDKVVFEGTLTDDYYILKKGDRLDIIAWKFYQTIAQDASKYWWIIADANNIHNPLELGDYIGKELLIPNLTRALLRL